MKKIFILFSVILLFCATLYQHDYKNIEDMAYIIAIGIDKREEKLYDYTFQFAIPIKFAGSNGEAGGEKDKNKNSENSSLYNVTVSAPSVYAALDLTENIFAKTPDLTHLKVIVFADDVLYDDMKSEVKDMIYSNRFRPNTYTAISNGTARNFLESVNPALELDPVKYYELLFEGKYAPYSVVSTLSDIYINSYADCKNAVIPYASVTKEKSDNDIIKSHQEIIKKKFNAENFLNLNTKKSVIMGMVIFNDEGIAFKSSVNESLIYHMINGNFTKTNYTFYETEDENNYVSIMLEESRKPVKKLIMNGYTPTINVDIFLKGKLLNIHSINISKDKLKTDIEESLENGCKDFLYKLSKKYNSDIFDFVSLAKKHYLTLNSWENEDWNTMYKNTKFNVKINLEFSGIE